MHRQAGSIHGAYVYTQWTPSSLRLHLHHTPNGYAMNKKRKSMEWASTSTSTSTRYILCMSVCILLISYTNSGNIDWPEGSDTRKSIGIHFGLLSNFLLFGSHTHTHTCMCNAALVHIPCYFSLLVLLFLFFSPSLFLLLVFFFASSSSSLFLLLFLLLLFFQCRNPEIDIRTPNNFSDRIFRSHFPVCRLFILFQARTAHQKKKNLSNKIILLLRI